MNDKTRLVVAGWLLNSAVMSLYQDAIGMEKYLAMVVTHWMKASYSVPLAIFMLICATLAIRTSNTPEHRTEDRR